MADQNAARQRFDDLAAEKAEVDKKLAPLRGERNRLRNEMAKLEAELREVSKRVKEAEAAAGVFQRDMDMAQAARESGARSVKAEGLGSAR